MPSCERLFERTVGRFRAAKELMKGTSMASRRMKGAFDCMDLWIRLEGDTLF